MVIIVTGPPCSGKTTYVTARRQPGDIVIDFDDIARALGSPGAHDHPRHIIEVTAAAWDAAVTRALSLHPGHRVWIIDTAPSPARRRRYALAGARHIPIKTSPAEIAERFTMRRRSKAVTHDAPGGVRISRSPGKPKSRANMP
jgi:predicted kinase